jgi:hypothetical protein
MRTIESRNILTLDRQHQVPVLAMLDNFRNRMGETNVIPKHVGDDEREPQETVRGCDPDDGLIWKDAQVLCRQLQGEGTTKGGDAGLPALLFSIQIRSVGRQGFVPGLLNRGGREREPGPGFSVTGMVNAVGGRCFQRGYYFYMKPDGLSENIPQRT